MPEASDVVPLHRDQLFAAIWLNSDDVIRRSVAARNVDRLPGRDDLVRGAAAVLADQAVELLLERSVATLSNKTAGSD